MASDLVKRTRDRRFSESLPFRQPAACSPVDQSDIDTAAANLLRFARKVDTTRIGEPATLAIVTATGYGYTRPDGVVVIPAATLGP